MTYDDLDSDLIRRVGKKILAAIAQATTAEEAAKAAHPIVAEAAREMGMKPELEVGISPPDFDGLPGKGGFWWVTWEAGPSDWGVDVSITLSFDGKAVVETYYGFDLIFHPAEWEGRR